MLDIAAREDNGVANVMFSLPNPTGSGSANIEEETKTLVPLQNG